MGKEHKFEEQDVIFLLSCPIKHRVTAHVYLATPSLAGDPDWESLD